jgi:hypothetical protein
MAYQLIIIFNHSKLIDRMNREAILHFQTIPNEHFPDGWDQADPRHIFFHSDFGVASGFCDAATFKAFYDAVKP